MEFFATGWVKSEITEHVQQFRNAAVPEHSRFFSADAMQLLFGGL